MNTADELCNMLTTNFCSYTSGGTSRDTLATPTMKFCLKFGEQL